jgi:hypothetical protein
MTRIFKLTNSQSVNLPGHGARQPAGIFLQKWSGHAVAGIKVRLRLVPHCPITGPEIHKSASTTIVASSVKMGMCWRSAFAINSLL